MDQVGYNLTSTSYVYKLQNCHYCQFNYSISFPTFPISSAGFLYKSFHQILNHQQLTVIYQNFSDAEHNLMILHRGSPY